MSAFSNFKDEVSALLGKKQPAVGPSAKQAPSAQTPEQSRPMDVDSVGPASSARLTSEYGNRIHPNSGKEKHHHGVDIGAGKTACYAAAAGIIEFAGFSKTGGNMVKIFYTDSVGNKHHLVYMHLDSIAVQKGQNVKIGDKIGVMGKTGASKGVHLHLEHWINGQHVRPSNAELRLAVPGLKLEN